MIQDLDATITAWLSGLAPYASVSFDRPGEQTTNGKQGRPALCLSLVDVQEHQAASTHSWSGQRSDEGQVVGRLPPNRIYRFTYLVSAIARDTLTEHELLGTVLVGLAADDVVPEQHLRGVLSDCGRTLMVRCAPDRQDARASEQWPTWNLTGRTCLELRVQAPLPAAAIADVAAAPSHVNLATSGARLPPATPPAEPRRRPTGQISEG